MQKSCRLYRAAKLQGWRPQQCTRAADASPGSTNLVWNGSALALNSFQVNFYGVAAHAGAEPEMGRSALDGVLLMDVGIWRVM